MPRTRNYYFSRLNIAWSSKNNNDKSKLIYSLLNSGNIIDKYNKKYYIANVEELSTKEFEIVYSGLLVRFADEEEAKVAKPKSRSVGTEVLNDPVEAQIRFFLEPITGFIIYQSNARLSHDTFRNRFEDTLESARDNIFISVNIEPIIDRYKIFDEMDRFESIKNYNVELHPSNPNPDPIWDDVEKDIKNRNAETYKEELDAGSGSLNIQDDEDIRKKLTMANDGYGVGEISGIDDEGKRKTVATSDQPARASVPIDDSLSLKNIWGYLRDTINNLKERFGYD